MLFGCFDVQLIICSMIRGIVQQFCLKRVKCTMFYNPSNNSNYLTRSKVFIMAFLAVVGNNLGLIQ